MKTIKDKIQETIDSLGWEQIQKLGASGKSKMKYRLWVYEPTWSDFRSIYIEQALFEHGEHGEFFETKKEAQESIGSFSVDKLRQERYYRSSNWA
jgi:hypothetical protein